MNANDKDIPAERKRRVREMFQAIAGRYDLLNHLLSAGVDLYWRRRALQLVQHERVEQVLDLATGTCDFALAARALGPSRVVGVDVATNMLHIGADKVSKRGLENQMALIGGDAEKLPFRDGSFDLATAAFGVRNFGDILTGLREAWRVLDSGGELVVLEFTQPQVPLFSHLYRLYFRHVLPVVGGLISGNRQAYAYLPESVGTTPQGDEFLELMAEAGFSKTRATPLTLGICAVYQGRKEIPAGPKSAVD